MPVTTESPARTFDTVGPIRASIEVVSGRVEVTAADAPLAEVTVTAADPHDDDAVAYAAMARIDGDGESLSVSMPHSPGRGLRRRPSEVVVRLVLPVGSDLNLRGAAVSLTTDGTLGDVAVRSASGRINLDTARGEVSVRTAAGDVEIGEVAGHASVRSGSSRVRIGRADGGLSVHGAAGQVHAIRVRGDVRIDTAAGDIRIDALAAGHTRLDAKMGNVEVGVVAGLPVHLDLHSAIGLVTCDLDETGEAPADGAESLRLDVHTAMGRVHVGPASLPA